MIYQYLYGDSYKTFDEKRKLERAQIKKYQDLYITPEVANNATAIKESNPTLSSGVISSLAYVNATPGNIQLASLEQAKINAQTHKNHITQVPPSFVSTIGEYLKESNEEYIESTPKLDPLRQRTKRTIRGIFQTWTAGLEALYQRSARANIMVAGELEQTLQDDYNLTPEEAQDIGKIWTWAGMLPITSSNVKYRNALTNSLGKLIVKKEFGIPEEFNQQKQQKAYKDAGPSSLEVVLKKISEEAELDTDDFIQNIPEAYKRLGVKGVTEIYDEMTGTGFISAGPAEDEANRLKEANLYGGRTITAGRYISDAVLGIENERADFWVSGLIDAAALIFLDPATYVTFGGAKGVQGGKKLKTANKTLNKLKELQKAGELDDAAEVARNFMKEDTSQAVADIILDYKGPDKFLQLLKANKDPDFALKLFEAENYDDILKAVEDSTFNGTNWNGPSFNGTKIIPDWLNNSAYKAFNNIRKNPSPDNPLSAIGKYLPEKEVNLENLTETLDAFVNYGVIAKVEKGFLNDTALKLTKELQKKNWYGAQKILVKDFYGHLTKKYAKNKETVKSFELWGDEALKRFRQQNVAYNVGDGKTVRAAKRIGFGAGKEKFFDVPWSYQLMERTFTFTDFRDVKRVVNTIDQALSRKINKGVNKFGDDTPIGNLLKEADLKVKDIDLSLPKTYTAGSDLLWKGQMGWSTMMLPFRVAYPMRLTLEGWLRGFLYGFDSPVNAPWSYINTLFFQKTDLLGKSFKTGGWSKRQLQDGLQKAVGNRRIKDVGPKGQRNIQLEEYSSYFYGDEIFENSDLMNRAVESLRVQYSLMWQNDITQLAADYLINNKSIKELAERFWTGDKKELWKNFTNTLEATIMPKNLNDIQKEIKGLQNHITSIAGGNRELIESFATGVYKGINMRNLNRRTSGNLKEVTKGIEKMLKEAGDLRPTDIPTPRALLESSSYEKYLKEFNRKGFRLWSDAIWHFSSAWEANAIRIPFYKQLYFRSIADDLLIADEKALAQYIKQIKKLPRALKKELYELHPELKKGDVALKELVAKNNLPKISKEAIDARAQVYAFNESTRIFYNLSQKGQVADALRFVFPFFEAFKEVAFSLTKGFKQKPGALLKASYMMQTGRRDGIIYKDPLTGDDYMAVPMPDWVANKWLGAGADKLNASITVPLSGFNLVGATLLPGVGPVMGIAIGVMSGTLKKTFGRDIYKIIVPYGTPIESIEDVGPDGIPTLFGKIYTPAYMRKLFSSGQIKLSKDFQSLLSEDAVASRALDSAKIISLNEPQSLQTEEEFAEFDEKVVELTKTRLFAEGILQGISPSPPRILYQTEFDIEAEDVPKYLKQYTDAVLDGIDLGKVDKIDGKNYVSIGVLALFYSELEKQMVDEFGDEDGRFYAWLAFTRMTGIESITDMKGMLQPSPEMTSAALLKEGKYDAISGKLPRTKQEADFKENNPEVVEKYKETYLYLMDDIQVLGELESTLFFEQLMNDDIEAVDPALFVIESQEFLWNLCYTNNAKVWKGDNSNEAKIERNKIRNWCDESFPLGTGDTELNLRKLLDRNIKDPTTYGSTWNTKLNELEKMAKDQSLKDFPVHKALRGWFINRDIELEKLASKSKTYSFPKDTKELEDTLRSGTSDEAQMARENLRETANILLSRYPEFFTVYDEVLRYEIQYNKNYEGFEEDEDE